MYDFVDKGDRHVALRPEQTASICRAFVQHRPATPWKVWYTGPNFRYEKPQRGRYRQFDQVGIEVLGPDDPDVDVEVITLGWDFLRALGLRKVTLLLNTLGESSERGAFVTSLEAYLRSRRSELSEESVSTLERNPLRVLDSKREQDQTIIDGAPTIMEFLGEKSISHFARVRYGLDLLEVPYRIDNRLVRGLDYYRQTTFEFAGGTLESAQNALGGGGRYDSLVEDLGGPATPGIGFAIGLDRTLLACDDEGVFPPENLDIDVFIVDTAGGSEALRLTNQLRREGFRIDRAFDNRSMKSQMKAADRSGAQYAVILGEDEIRSGTVLLKSLRSDEGQQSVSSGDLAARLREKIT
jgi:histidyl-tRNA synthetase